MVLGISFITVAASREGIVEYLGSLQFDLDACIFFVTQFLLLQLLFVALGLCVVLGINYISVAVSRGGSLFSI